MQLLLTAKRSSSAGGGGGGGITFFELEFIEFNFKVELFDLVLLVLLMRLVDIVADKSK